jgi:hypothetical protein
MGEDESVIRVHQRIGVSKTLIHYFSPLTSYNHAVAGIPGRSFPAIHNIIWLVLSKASTIARWKKMKNQMSLWRIMWISLGCRKRS